MDVKISELSLNYGDFQAVKNLSLEIAEGESLVLLGESGCGKTSTMRCIAGLEDPSTGMISIGGNTVFDSQNGKNVTPNKRNVGMVFQSYAIWPHLTVLENVAFPLQMKRLPKKAIEKKALETLDLVGLGHLASKGASLLSGGQMQRVALARSLAMGPSVMLLDEPLSNLDARLRESLRAELRRMQLDLGLTSIYVTHDQGEALALADRIAIMQNGKISQLAAPEDLYNTPASASIAEFLGVSNIFSVETITNNKATLATFPLEVTIEASDGSSKQNSALCIRPENIRLEKTQSNSSKNSWAGTVVVKLFQGSYIRWTVELDAGPTFEIETPATASSDLSPHSRVFVEVDPSDILVLPSEIEGVEPPEMRGSPFEDQVLDTRSLQALSTRSKNRLFR